MRIIPQTAYRRTARSNIPTLDQLIFTLLLTLATIGQLEVANQLFVRHALTIATVWTLILQLSHRCKLSNAIWCCILVLLLTWMILWRGVNTNIDLIVEIYRAHSLLLIAMVGMQFSRIEYRRAEWVLKHALDFYLIVSIVIIFDVALYVISGTTLISSVNNYVTPRFSGPYFDGNFLSFVFSVVMILEWFTTRRRIRIVLFFACVLLGGSFFVIVFSFISILLTRLFVINRMLLVLIATILINIASVLLFYQQLDDVTSLIVSGLSLFGVDSESASAKALSLAYRIEVQYDALILLLDNPLGYGARSIPQLLERDPHNSYIGVALELGSPALLSIAAAYSQVRTRGRMASAAAVFISLCSLVLNVFYMPVYVLAIAMISLIRGSRYRSQ